MGSILQVVRTIAFMLIMLPFLFHALNKTDIREEWLSEDEDHRIEIYKNKDDGKFYGKSRAGHVILEDLVYDRSSHTYSGKLVSDEGYKIPAAVRMLHRDTIKITSHTFSIHQTLIFTKKTEK